MLLHLRPSILLEMVGVLTGWNDPCNSESPLVQHTFSRFWTCGLTSVGRTLYHPERYSSCISLFPSIIDWLDIIFVIISRPKTVHCHEYSHLSIHIVGSKAVWPAVHSISDCSRFNSKPLLNTIKVTLQTSCASYAL